MIPSPGTDLNLDVLWEHQAEAEEDCMSSDWAWRYATDMGCALMEVERLIEVVRDLQVERLRG